MSKLSLSIACHPYDRVRAIIDQRVPIEGCDVNFVSLPPVEAFLRAFRSQDFDVTEMSLSSQILAAGRGDAHYVAVPAFVSRVFRHSAFYVRTDRGIQGPADLRGKLVGVDEYQMTAALWARGILSDEYGVKANEIRWRSEAPPRSPMHLPAGFDHEVIPSGRTQSDMLEKGELDAVISPRVPLCFQRGDPNVARLFPDYRTAEEAYFKRTRMFPLMHTIVVRKSLLERQPWVAASVYKAFLQAKEIALAELAEIRLLNTSLAWVGEDLRRTQEVLGPDIWPYGVQGNRRELEAMMRWSVEQGLAPRKISIEDLFAPGTISD